MKIRSLALTLILFGMVVSTDGFQLHGSAGPLTARLGGAVLLPCSADRPLPLEELEVDWRRTDSQTIVHLFQEGQSRPESQGDAYRDRAHFFSQEIPKGNFSLLLEDVRTADAGVYECVVYTKQEHHETQVAIRQVERLVVTGADEAVYAHVAEDVTLSCSVDTHVNVTELYVEWRKIDDDILVLLYDDGEIRPESQPERYSGRAEFFIEEIPKGNFSMKLWKVRTEDNGEFMCEIHTNTESANTTVRISPLGYSSLHWLILVLCFAVTAILVLITAFSLRHLKLSGESKQPVLYHCLYIIVPSIMVFIAFSLWGVTEGSTEEAVTCAFISLLNALMLFNLIPDDLFTGIAQKIKYQARRLESGIFIIFIGTFAIIEFTTNYSTYTAEKVVLGYFVGVFIATMTFTVSLQVGYIFLKKDVTLSTYKKVLGSIAVLLIIYISSATAVSVYLTKYLSTTVSKEMLIVLIVPMIVVLFPFVCCGIVLICYIRKPREQQRPIIRYFFMCIPSFSYFMILAVYNHLITLVHNVFIPGYFLAIVIAPSLMFASFVAKVYMYSWRHFYLSQRILLVITFLLYPIISVKYVSLTLEDDKERLVKLAQYTFIYSSTVTSFFDDWLRVDLLDKPRMLLYWLGTVCLPLVNSVALAVVLLLKSGKWSLDLRLVVFSSESFFLFIWFLIKITEYWMDKKKEIKQSFACLQRHQDNEPYQGSHDYQEMEAFSPTDSNGAETEEVPWSRTDKSKGS